MPAILLTQTSTPIIGQIAWILGKLMNGIFVFLNNFFGIENIGLCIIIFTIIIYTLLMPLTIKQQKFTRMSAVMNPELQAIQKKYANKKDQASMQKQQDEMKLVYEKYGTSPTGGCLQLVIQMPILFGLYQVIRNIPAYVTSVKGVYAGLATTIAGNADYVKIIGKIGKAAPVQMDPSKYDYTSVNVVIDALYKFQTTTWEKLSTAAPALGDTITNVSHEVSKFSQFCGISIINSPWTTMKENFSSHIGLAIVAVLIPILAGLTQWLNLKLMPQQATGDNQMAGTMKSMNMMMPLMSVYMGFILPTGLGIYWIASAVVRTVQMLAINKHLEKMDVNDLVKENMEKAAKKRENKKEHVDNINEKAQVRTKSISERANMNVSKNANNTNTASKTNTTSKANDAADTNVSKEASKATKSNTKPGSLASKANLVKDFNESR